MRKYKNILKEHNEDIIAYHGSQVTNITKFNDINSYGKKGIFFCDDKELAKCFTYGVSEGLYICKLSPETKIILNANGTSFNDLTIGGEEHVHIIDLLDKYCNKCDCLQIDNIFEYGNYLVTDYIVFNPDIITILMQESSKKKFTGKNYLKEDINDNKIKQYIKECIEICRKCGYDYEYEKINFDISNRTNDLGDYTFANNKLRLNRKLFDSEEDSIKNTILHELGHYIVYQICLDRKYIIKDKFGDYVWDNYSINRSPYTRSDLKPHGRLWKQVTDKLSEYIDSTISRLGHDDNFEKQRESSMRYTVTCTNCGNNILYNRATEFVKEPNKKSSYGDWYKWQCGQCKKSGFFKVKDNKTGKEWN